MRSLSFSVLSAEEFAGFAMYAPQGNFQQTTMAAQLRSEQGIATEFVGVRENGEIVAAALIETQGRSAAPFCAIHDGPLCDFEDRELTVFFMEQLEQYAKQRNAVHLDITPEKPYRVLNDQGQPFTAEDGSVEVISEPDTAMMENLQAAGMKHEGFTRGYTAVPRWRFVKDLTGITTADELLASYSKRTQWSVKRAQSMGVYIEEIDIGGLDIFAFIEQQTAQRRHFTYRGEDYFEQFAEAYGDRAHFLLAVLDTQTYYAAMKYKVDDLQKTVDTLEAKIAKHKTTKLQRRLQEESNNLAAAQKRFDDAFSLFKQAAHIPMAASLFVEMPEEVVYLFSGSMEKYNRFYGSALIQYYAMLHFCVEKGINRYNFYGIDGIFDDPESEGHGVLEFKQGFNGFVEELPGEFMYVLRPARYTMIQMAHKLHSLIKRPKKS